MLFDHGRCDTQIGGNCYGRAILADGESGRIFGVVGDRKRMNSQIADVFDTLSTKRPYKAAIPIEGCLRILEQGRGSHFDPEVVDAFFRRKSEIVRTYHEYADAT